MRVVHAAQIDGEHHAARDDVAGARLGLDDADGRHHAVLRAADPLRRQHHFRAAGERVAPHGHRHGAGVARFAGDDDAPAALPDDAGDHAERLVFGFQPRPLLDMHLDIAERFAAFVRRLRNVGGVLAVGLERVGKGHAIAVGERERLGLEHAGASRRRRQRRGKARAFLVAEGQHVDRQRRLAAEMPDRENARDHAERAVVVAAVHHAVEMRADQQPRPLAHAPAHRSERVFRHAQARRAHPLRRQIRGAAMLGRQKQPHQAVRLGRNRRQLLDHRLGARAERGGV